jgi:carboxyl-terminal processing protease
MKDKIMLRYKRVQESVETADEEDIANGLLSALARAHDPHTEYFSPREMKQFTVDISNKLIGIGALLRAEDDGATKIEGIVNNGPADKAGELKLGDRIIGVDSKNDGNWTDIMFLPLDKVVEKIRGEENSEVALKVEPADGAPGEIRVYVIKREPVDMKEEQTSAEVVVYRENGEETKIGVIRIPQFYFDQADNSRGVSSHVGVLVRRLKKEGIDGMILDLRGNGGGSLDEVERMTGFFNGKGPVVQIKKYTGQVEPHRSRSYKPLYDGPLVVLTDKGSASASEILAGALQDYKRAVIVGSKNTFGKGTVQQPIPIARYARFFKQDDRVGAIKLTIQKYYRPSGSSVQIKGVEPDVQLPALTDVLEVGEGHAKHALPHDLIRPDSNFKPFDGSHLFIPELKKKSEARVSANQDFLYLREDMARIKKQLDENRISINLAERKKENAENEQRRKARNKERRERFEAVEKKDEESMKIYRLSLEDLESDVLPEVDLKDDDERHMRRAKDEVADLDDTPEWPSGIDAVKREGLAIMRDLIGLQRSEGVTFNVKK